MPAEFSASSESVDASTQIVAISGEIDIFTAPEFKGIIGKAIDSGRDVVIVDLSGATFIDSSSLGVLISAQRRLALRDGRLIVATDVPAVRSTFKITGLDSVLEVVDTRQLALETRAGPADAAA